MSDSYKVADLFSGCGGLSLGFENAGFNIVSAYENWDAAAAVYEKNFSHPVYRQDLNDVEATVNRLQSDGVNLIIGGPPCQDFSHAGKRVESSRASLTDSFSQIVAGVKPKIFVMENVDRARNSQAFQRALENFKKAGYGLTIRVLDASLCGVPQKRKRLFCIGVIGEEDGFADQLIDTKLEKKHMTLRDYFGDSLGFEFYYRHPRNYERRGVFSIDEPAPTMRGVNRPVPKGYPGNPNDACCLAEHPEVRALTTKERSLIQTFPASFFFDHKKTDAEQMIGNAVPVKLAEFVANVLQDYLHKRDKNMTSLEENKEAFRSWLQEKQYVRRTINDILSRVNYAEKLLGPMTKKSDPGYLKVDLERIQEFKSKSTSVKSHIRKAIDLYCDFLNDN